jgi:aspartate aminotransferase
VVAVSPTLAINETVEERRAAGEPVLHLGFGEAGLPVLPEVAETLVRAVARNSYAPVTGTPPARAAAARWFMRRGLPTDPEQVVFAPGSKPLLYALLASLPGDVVLPQPSWVSYAAQVKLCHKQVISVPAPAPAGGVPDPDLLPAALRRARDAGLSPGVMVLTLPDNPTGTIAGMDLVERVCQVAVDHDLAIVSDEIYRDLAYEPSVHPSPTLLAPERCFVTTGLSKSLALGGWRIGFARFPHGVLGDGTRRDVVGLASEVWSSLAEPMQEVAAHVLDEPPEVVDHINASRRLHQAVATAVYDELHALGVSCRRPEAAFYVYPDMAPHRETLARHGITTGAELATHLLERHGVGVLPGEAFGDDPCALRFRVATSLLYGRSEAERWMALHSPDPLALPWIAQALDTFRTALRALLGVAAPGSPVPRRRSGNGVARIG